MHARRRHKFAVIANRLPVRREGRGRAAHWVLSPGGLVSALVPVMQERKGVWIGWPGNHGKAPEPFEHEGISNFPVPLRERELEEFYDGFSNRTIWPLYHDAVRWPDYHREWWSTYVDINQRFAEAAASQLGKGATAWVQDYHLQLVPRMLRELRPDLRIGFFLHIPFPPPELFQQLPWRKEILEGLLGADVVGFQSPRGASNFARLARRFAGAKGDRRGLQHDGRKIGARAFPISIDHRRYEELARRDDVRERAARFRAELGEGRRIMLGVDRLDYTKGIDIRLKAFGELLDSGRLSAKDTVFVQCAVPSRQKVSEYIQLRSRVEEQVGRINGDHAPLGHSAVHYMHRSFDTPELVSLYLAADVMLVTPLRDGMNLVAKEYCAVRYGEGGVLVLSEFTGAARQLDEALLVNPYDVEGLKQALVDALEMPADEARRRMRALRRTVRRHDVYEWADDFLGALSP